MRGRRRGVALIEVLAALVLLSSCGIGLIVLLGQTAHTMRGIQTAERIQRAASAELDRLVALDRYDLSGLAGRTLARGFVLTIVERDAGLFDASVAESDTTPAFALTTLYRPDTAHVAP
jgi:Tfp pilus assembly protein PilV